MTTRRCVVVRGATLSGMAAAARLTRLGHEVVLVTGGEPLGGRWAPEAGPGGPTVDAMPQVICLPATWRDLFKKSGSHLQAELNRAGLDFVPAPPALHRFADGTDLELPSERGAQFRAVEHAFGPDVAARWRRLIDGLDDVWLAYRRHALEGMAPVAGKPDRARLWLDRTLGDLTEGLGERLGRVVTDLGQSPRAPGLLTIRLHVEQTFGRWQLVDGDGVPQPASRLIWILTERLRERGVGVVEAAADTPDVDCLPHLPKGTWLRPAPGAASAPRVTHELREPTGKGVREVVDHTGPRPVVTWLRPTDDGDLATIHDHNTVTPDPSWGVATGSAGDWLARTPILGDGHLRASACSPAGAEPWAELASAALAVYELHERLTGEDSRPTNRDFRPPRLPRHGVYHQ